MHAQRWSCYCGVATGKTGRQSFITQSVACGNDDLDTAAATKYRAVDTAAAHQGGWRNRSGFETNERTRT